MILSNGAPFKNALKLSTFVLNYDNGSHLYNNITSCVLNNGFATRHFNLSRGVRQGCPLSGIVFVVGVEILSNAIKRSREIEGIQIDPNNSIKITQYADDTTIFVKDIRSVHRLFDLLQQFENCSGLRINQSKSEILWLGHNQYLRNAFTDSNFRLLSA